MSEPDRRQFEAYALLELKLPWTIVKFNRTLEEAVQRLAQQSKIPKVGSIVRVLSTHNKAWAGIGVVFESRSVQGYYRIYMFSGQMRGSRGGFYAEQLEVVHGYIHVDGAWGSHGPLDEEHKI